MLVLSRKADEEIIIELPGVEPVVVTVVRIAGGTVRLGVSAPQEVGIHRGEVFERILEERKDGAA